MILIKKKTTNNYNKYCKGKSDVTANFGFFHFLMQFVKDIFFLPQKISTLTLAQCRRQSNQSEGASAESRGALKYTEIFHLKTDVFRLQIMRYFNNFVFISEKRDV